MRDLTGFLPLERDEDLKRALEHSTSEPVVVFKHSISCPVSGRANAEMARLAGDEHPVYRLIVQRARRLSEAIEDLLGIGHESPQVIVVRDRTAVYDTSHAHITAASVRGVVQGPTGAPGQRTTSEVHDTDMPGRVRPDQALDDGPEEPAKPN